MGKLRSKDGCLTCRFRHVKCDEVRPLCGQCRKRNRTCQREDQSGIEIKNYHPPKIRKDDANHTAHIEAASRLPLYRQNTRSSGADDDTSFVTPNEEFGVSRRTQHFATVLNAFPNPSPAEVQVSARPPSTPADIASNYYTANGIPISQLVQQDSHSPLSHHSTQWALASPSTSAVSPSATITGTLTFNEAYLVHYFVKHLGRWLDCTDATRQFTLKIPELVKTSPVLLHAVMSFAARHAGDADAAEKAHDRCVELLIPLLNADSAVDDDVLLCAIVILRVFEQLNVMVTGSDEERHLAGCSALLRASQGLEVDPSTPGLRQAAFWVYMRQCLYNACVNQQPPNVDLDLVLSPVPVSSDPISDLRSETAWANTMTWTCATVMQFCFASGFQEPSERMKNWQASSDAVKSWMKGRPHTFDPIYCNDPVIGGGNPFPEFWFTADWHVMAFGFYHLACMLLIIYKPSAKFAVRGIRASLRESDIQVMLHARAICGACKSSPSTVPSLITLCHTVFIWGPLVTDQAERNGVIELLRNMESEHAWPTAWITNSLQDEWATN